jgi:hypothetical protein
MRPAELVLVAGPNGSGKIEARLDATAKAPKPRPPADSPALKAFAAELVELDEHGGPIARATLRAVYEQWCKEKGLRPVSHVEFTQAMREIARGETRSNGRRFWVGLKLRTPERWNVN